MTPYLGEIRLLPYTFAPVGWQDCDGTLLSISENEALYNLIGTTYGGNGQTDFAVPDLRGRLPVHQGTGSGMGGSYVLGQVGGTETVTLTTLQLPGHSHPAAVTSATATTSVPSATVLPGAPSGDTMYTSDTSGLNPIVMAPGMIGQAGGNQPHDNTMPTLAVRFCIAVDGIYPSQS